MILCDGVFAHFLVPSLLNQAYKSLFSPVRPDPPVSLNWTLLNISPSGLSYDVIVNWESPPSADVKAGWMRIEYEIQYREMNSTNWEAVSHRCMNPLPPPWNRQSALVLLHSDTVHPDPV